jgi:uncharacterized protein (DUF39 family)
MPLFLPDKIFIMQRTIDEINEKIALSKASVLTAHEAKELIAEKGIKYFFSNVDLITCASFEMVTNALLYLSFGQTDPLIYFSEAYINNVSAVPAGPTDLILSSVTSAKDNVEYSGSNIIEDLVSGRDLQLKAIGKSLPVFPNREFDTWFNLSNLNSARIFFNQLVNQNNIVATNSGDKDIDSHMGTLIGKIENSTFNSSSSLNPLLNDPYCKTIGIGTRIWIAGGSGYITGFGSNHNPSQKRNKYGVPVGPAITLSGYVDLVNIDPKWLRAGYLRSFGPVLFVGLGVPIPILNEEIVNYIGITDDKINTTIVDFSIPRRTKPTFGQCTYSELRTSTVMINDKPTLTAPLSSMAGAVQICNILKDLILGKKFYLTKQVESINLELEQKKLDSRLSESAY